MALNKSPSMTYPSCSVLSNQPVSSVDKLTMNSKIKSDTIVRPNSQPLKPSKIPSLIVKPERYSSVPTLGYLTSPQSTYTLKPTSAAHTRPWRPQSVLPEHVKSETHLPNPKLAKLLDRGWKSGPILPSYPLAGPECITQMSRPPSGSASSTKQTNINATKGTNSNTSFSKRNDVDYGNSSSEHSHPKLYKKICCIPIPIFRSRPNVKLTANDDAYTIRQQPTAERCGSSRSGNFDTGGSAYLQQSRIPVARSTSPRGESINACKSKGFDSRPISAKSALIRGTSKIPVLSNKVVTPLAETPISNFSTCLNTEVPRAQNVPSLKYLSERAVNEMSVNRDSYASRAHNVPSLASLAERSVSEMSVNRDINVSRAQNVPSLVSLAERAVSEISVNRDSYCSREHNFPSLASLAEKAVNEISVYRATFDSITQNVPSLESLAEKAVNEINVYRGTFDSRTQNVPSLVSLAEKAVNEISVYRGTFDSKAQNVPSLVSLAERAVSEIRVNRDTHVVSAQNVPSLASLAEKAVNEISVNRDTFDSRAQNAPSLVSLAERAVSEMSVNWDTHVARAHNFPSLASLAEKAVNEMSVNRDTFDSRAQNVPSLTSFAERAVSEMSVNRDTHVARAQNVPSLVSLAENAVNEISVNRDIFDSRAQNVPSLVSLAERAVSKMRVNRDTHVARAQNVPSLVSLAEKAVNEISLLQSAEVQRVQDIPSLKSLAENFIVDNSLTNDTNVPRTQEIPSLKSLAKHVVIENNLTWTTNVRAAQKAPSMNFLPEKFVSENNLEQNIEVPITQAIPSLKFLAGKAADEKGLKQNSKVHIAQKVSHMKMIEGKAVDEASIKNEIEGPRSQTVPSLNFLAGKVVTENSLKQNSDVHGIPSLKFLAGKTVDENASIVTDKIVADLAYSENSFEQEKIHLDSTSNPKVSDAKSSVPSGKVSRASDSKRQISCCSTRRSRPSTRESEMLKTKDDSKRTKFEVADKAADKSDWNYYSTERALKKTNEATDVANGDKKKTDHCATVELKKKTRDSCSWRRTYELLKLPKSDNAASTGPRSTSTSVSSVSLNLQISNVKEKTKEPTENGTNTGRTKSCDNEQIDKKTPRSKQKKTIKRVADKVNRHKLERLKVDRDDISNSDVFKMITAIHEEDDDAAKMLEELKLINQLEEEQKNKMKNKVEEAQLVAEKGDFKHKVAGTNEKKKQIDRKLLSTLKKEPDNEDNLHKDRMTKTCREKKKSEKCNISHPELELQTKTEQQSQKRLKKTKEPKIKPKMTKNATRMQKENGQKVREDKIHKLEDKFKNDKHLGKGKHAEASYANDPNNYKSLPKGSKEYASTEKNAKFSSESLPIIETNTASSVSSKQSKRQFLSQTGEDLKNKQNNSQVEKRNMRKRKDDCERKKDGPSSEGTFGKTAGASKQEMRHSAVHVRNTKTETKHETTQSTCIFPKINIHGSKTAPKPNGNKSASSEQRALRINGGSKQPRTDSEKKQSTSKPKDMNRSREVFKVQRESNSNINGTDVAKPYKKINTNDDTQREKHEDHLRRAKMEPNTLNRYVVQRKAKPGYRNTQLPPLQLKPGKQSGAANQPAAETQRMQRSKVSKQRAQDIKERQTK